jgi:hypothetical protein
VACNFQFVVVSGLHDGVHFFERHAQRVVVVRVGRGGVAGGVRLDPFHAVLHELANRRASLVGSADQQDQPFHADLAELGIPVHQPASSADLSTAGRQTWSEHQVVLNRLFQPEIDIEQAAAAASRRVPAFERQLRVTRGQNRDVLNRVFDVEIFQRGHIEIRRMKVSLDQSRHDRAAVGVDDLGVRWDGRSAGSGAGIGDRAILNQQQPVRNRCRSRSINKLSVSNHCLSGCSLHAGVSDWWLTYG